MIKYTDLLKHKYGTQFDGESFLTTRLSYDASGNLEYWGVSATGASASDPVWMIRKLIYDASGNTTAILFNNGKANFDQSWDNRAGVTYQ